MEKQILFIIRQSPEGITAKNILEYLHKQGQDSSQPTLSRKLKQFITQGKIQSTGRGRATRYIADNLHEYFAVPPSKRLPVGYTRDRLISYRPNEDSWFSDKEKQELFAAGNRKPLAGMSYAKAIAQKLIVDFSWASSSLEGNTYSYLDTEALILYGQEAEGKSLEETQMILNHKDAVSYLIDYIDQIHAGEHEIRSLHALLSRGLLPPLESGAIRTTMVSIAGSAYTPIAVPQQIEEQFRICMEKASEIANPFEQSLFLMAFIAYIQPFRDVNKRTGRLTSNIPLLKAGLSPFSFIDTDKTAYISGLLAFYELGRIDVLKNMFVQSYLKTADRYQAYLGRAPEALSMEVRYRNQMNTLMRAHINAVTNSGRMTHIEESLHGLSLPIRPNDLDIFKKTVQENLTGLSQNNCIAYGISWEAFKAYEAILTGVNQKGS